MRVILARGRPNRPYVAARPRRELEVHRCLGRPVCTNTAHRGVAAPTVRTVVVEYKSEQMPVQTRGDSSPRQWSRQKTRRRASAWLRGQFGSAQTRASRERGTIYARLFLRIDGRDSFDYSSTRPLLPSQCPSPSDSLSLEVSSRVLSLRHPQSLGTRGGFTHSRRTGADWLGMHLQ